MTENYWIYDIKLLNLWQEITEFMAENYWIYDSNRIKFMIANY